MFEILKRVKKYEIRQKVDLIGLKINSEYSNISP